MSDSPMVPTSEPEVPYFPTIPTQFETPEEILVEHILKPYSLIFYQFDILQEELRKAQMELQKHWESHCKSLGYDPEEIPKLQQALRDHVQGYVHHQTASTGQRNWVDDLVQVQARVRLQDPSGWTPEKRQEVRTWAKGKSELWKLSTDKKVLTRLAAWLMNAGLYDFLDLDTRVLLSKATNGEDPDGVIPVEDYFTNFTDGTWDVILGTLRLKAEFDRDFNPEEVMVPPITIMDGFWESPRPVSLTPPEPEFGIQIKFSSSDETPSSHQLTPGDQ